MLYFDLETIFSEVNYTSDQIIFKGGGASDKYRVCFFKVINTACNYLTISSL